MDTEFTLDQTSASSSTPARHAEEFDGHHNAAAIGQVLHASPDDHPKSPDAIPDAPTLAEQFAGIVYFSEMTADNQGDRRSTYHRNAGGTPGAESVRYTRGRRTSTRPWRLPAGNRATKG